MNYSKAAEDFVSTLALKYFEGRDLEGVADCLEERISWIGTGADEISRSKAEAKEALGRDIAEYGGKFKVTDLCCTAMPLAERAFVVYGNAHAVPEESSVEEQDVRFSAVTECTEAGMGLVHLHFSHADFIQEEGRCFVPKDARRDNLSLREALNLRRMQLELLTNNIPGGIHKCAADEGFTLLSMSEGFLNMLGFTDKEIEEQFKNKFINLIYPPDREEVRCKLQKQLEKGQTSELEYRVLRKDASPIWVLDKAKLLEEGDGGKCFYCLLVEITDRKNEQEELRLSLERHQVILNQATDIIFEWDIRRDTLSFSQNWRKKFGYQPIEDNISNDIPMSQDIHPDDMKAFEKIMTDTAKGKPYSEAEFRIRNRLNQYIWCKIRATTQFNDSGLPIKAVGVIIDIDAEKKQKQVLLEQAQRDALTGLYNKVTINSLVEQRMKGGYTQKLQALMIIDVDHFKAVNDTYGHLCGDSLLSDVANVLKRQMRSTDLSGRIGGDEFLVYMPEVADEGAVRVKAERLLEALHALSPGKGMPHITCSIGIAVTLRNTVNYLELYKCADQALYHRKNTSRDGFAFYNEDLELKTSASNERTAVSADITSDEEGAEDDQLAQYAFRTLHEAVDIKAALDKVLEIVGRSYDVSRTYIFESMEDERYASITFEWCSADATPQKDVLQNLSYEEDLGDYQKNFDKNGVFYCHDIKEVSEELFEILKPQGIHSMLQCAIKQDGKFFGGIGFDECRENRRWSKRQIASYKLTANVLAEFVIKLRLKEKLARLENELQAKTNNEK